MYRSSLRFPVAHVLLTLAVTTAGSAQDLIPECYTVSRAWPELAVYNTHDEGVSPYLSPQFEALQSLIAKAGTVPGLTDSARDERLHRQVAALWATKPERYEMLLAYLIAEGGYDIVLDGGGLQRAVWLYREFSGRAWPLLHYFGQSERMERLPSVLVAITRPLAADEQAAVLRIGCDAAWLLSRGSADSQYWRSPAPKPYVMGSGPSRDLELAYRLSAGLERDLLRRQIVQLNSRYRLGIPLRD